MSYERGLEWLKTSQLDYLPFREKRGDVNPEKSLIENISRNGILTPLVVRRVQQRYEVVDGHKRLKVAEEQNLGDIPCLVVEECDERDAEALYFSLNKLSEDAEPEEVLDLFRELLEAGFDRGEMEELFGEEVFAELEEYLKIEEMKKDSGFSLDEFGDHFIPEKYIETPPFPVTLNFQSKEEERRFKTLLDMYEGKTGHEKARNLIEELGVEELCISENSQQQVVLRKWT